MPKHRKGRKAKRYPGSWDDLFTFVTYDPTTGRINTTDKTPSKGTQMKDGHLHLRIPTGVDVTTVGNKKAEYFRADHIAWMLVTEEWPEGWIEHVNGLKMDCTMENLVHVDSNGDRWWFGSQGREEPSLVKVEAEGGLNVEGPLTFRVTINGEVMVKPVVCEEYRTTDMDPIDPDPTEEDDMPVFGVDWMPEDDIESEVTDGEADP